MDFNADCRLYIDGDRKLSGGPSADRANRWVSSVWFYFYDAAWESLPNVRFPRWIVGPDGWQQWRMM